MATYVVTEIIAAAPDAIWPVLADVSQWSNWTPTVSKVDPLDGQELRIGARFKVSQPKLRPTIWTVTAIEPLKSFTWTAKSPGLQMIAEHCLSVETANRTRLELSFTFGGPLGSIVGLLARRLTMSYMSIEASSLKAKVQAQAAT
jgi:hypothetical protein